MRLIACHNGGHDFRPSYRAIGFFLSQLDQQPYISAFTATATPEVIEDICTLLAIDTEDVYVTGFKRENLAFSVLRGVSKSDFLKEYLQINQNQSGIIYTATRKDVDLLYDYFSSKGYSVGKYHAGLGEEERKSYQEKFLYDDCKIIFATNAFGMGIDKSNVRFVIHYNMPRNLEAYYQEAGRAGRDGDPSECILLYNPRDVQLQKYLIEQSALTPERKSQEYRKLQQMNDYCYSQRCLQSYITSYFGEDIADECGKCSNCKDDFEKVDITVEAQKIFSCIRRMNERFGSTLVAKVLKGSKDKRVLDFQFHKLPTYGLMKKQTEKSIVEMINMLVAEGYLSLTEGEFPVVKLTPSVLPVLKGEEQVFQRVKKQYETVVEDNELFEQLRQLRRDVAAREQVPPYIVFADSTLRELSQQCPTTRADMLRVKGVGEAKFEKYGFEFLQEIIKYQEKRG